MRVFMDWLLTPFRVGIHLPTATAVARDLHVGYNEARRRSGDSVPVGDIAALVAPLEHAFREYDVERLIIAGDLVEDRLSNTAVPGFLNWLDGTGVELVAVVQGNHDRGKPAANSDLPLCHDPVTLGEWRVVHGNELLPGGFVVYGHFHPCIRRRGSRLACYLAGATELVLPAYSLDASGANILRDQRWHGYRCYAIVGSEVQDFGITGIRPARSKRRW